jgi:hypothetical protein
MGKIKQFFKENKKDITKYSIQGVISVIICGVFLMFWLHYVRATEGIGNTITLGNGVTIGTANNYGVTQSRYEITEAKDKIAYFNLNITWKDGKSEDYGKFGIFLGTPLQVDMGDGWRNFTTAVYYSPMLTSKTQDNVKLVVKPKKTKVRGDPTFYRGTDYDNSTKIDHISMETDAIFYDQDTNELTYNFIIYVDSQSKDNYVTAIQIVNPTAVTAEHP